MPGPYDYDFIEHIIQGNVRIRDGKPTLLVSAAAREIHITQISEHESKELAHLLESELEKVGKIEQSDRFKKNYAFWHEGNTLASLIEDRCKLEQELRKLPEIQDELNTEYKIGEPKYKRLFLDVLERHYKGKEAIPRYNYQSIAYENYTVISSELLLNVLFLLKPDCEIRMKLKEGYLYGHQLHDVDLSQLETIYNSLPSDLESKEINQTIFLNVIRVYGNAKQISWFADKVLEKKYGNYFKKMLERGELVFREKSMQHVVSPHEIDMKLTL